MSGKTNAAFLFREGTAALHRSRRGAALAALMTMVTIFSAGLFHSLGSGLAATARGWANESLLVIYLSPGAGQDTATRAALELLRTSGLVREIRSVSPSDARERFGKIYGGLAGAADQAGDQGFPSSIEAAPLPGTPETKREKLLSDLAAVPGVEEVQYDLAWIERLGRVARAVRILGGGLLLLLGTGAALTASGAMRFSLLAAREEIRVLRLVGATEWVIRGPYLVAGAIVGVIGSTIAVGLLFVVIGVGGRFLTRELPVIPVSAFPPPSLLEIFALVGIGLSASAAGSWLASRDTEAIR